MAPVAPCRPPGPPAGRPALQPEESRLAPVRPAGPARRAADLGRRCPLGDVLAVCRIRPARLGRRLGLFLLPERIALAGLGSDPAGRRRDVSRMARTSIVGNGDIHRPEEGPAETRPGPMLPQGRLPQSPVP